MGLSHFADTGRQLSILLAIPLGTGNLQNLDISVVCQATIPNGIYTGREGVASPLRSAGHMDAG